jgi:hypothetical protein
MKVITSKVLNGRIELPSDIAEGTFVAVLAPDGDGFHLTSAQDSELTEALAAIDSGNFEDGAALLAELRRPLVS